MTALALRTASLINVDGSKPNVSSTRPTTSETTMRRTATIAGGPPANRASPLLVIAGDSDKAIALPAPAGGYRRQPHA